ncbi:hypothetical protein NXC14_PA00074 (plasmid) [Rhizobium sp. NXC14]|nr:hypothetical protein NXC14_PA00074 [Rhizobium sp. NXC14]
MITCAHRAYTIKVGAVLLVSPIIVGAPDLDRSYGCTDSVAHASMIPMLCLHFDLT